MNIIVAADEKWGIGKNNKLLTHLPEDMKLFKDMTTNKVVVMGRKTLCSLPDMKALKNRVNIVLTRNKYFHSDDVIVCHSFNEVFDAIKDYNTDDVFIIGGENVYKQFISYCSKIYVTRIHHEFDADAYFPDLDKNPKWNIQTKLQMTSESGFDYSLCMYTQNKVKTKKG